MLARKYLCVPGTSVPSERLFSKAELIVDKKRSQMEGDNIDKLIFIAANYKQEV